MDISALLARPDVDELTIPDSCEAIALCGGPYSNFAAVDAFLQETADLSGVSEPGASKAFPQRFCLGDIGGFGPLPNRTIELIRQSGMVCLQGNYDDAVGNGMRDCGCGYSDPRDRHFAQLSYDYTYEHTAPEHREWMRSLPSLIVLHWRDSRILLCHGSPDLVNEFVWQSETSDDKVLGYLQRYGVDGICATHSGLPWLRTVQRDPEQRDSKADGFWMNVGVLGRPANTGKQSVTYGLLTYPLQAAAPTPEIKSLDYDVAATARAMRAEGLPEEFVDSLETGIWTTCAEILPEAERAVGARVLVS